MPPLLVVSETAPLERAIGQGIAFLRRSQLPHGEFAVGFSRSRELLPVTPDSSPFGTATILYSLSHLDHPAAEEMRRNGRAFLLEEMEGVGLWRYTSSRNRERIAPDLDVTCVGSYVLREYHGRLFFGSNHPAILANRNSAGLFNTWIRADGEKNDVDSVVNANVLLYLGEREETEAAARYLNDLVLSDRVEGSSWYYPDPLSLYYVLSRAFFHGVSSLGRTSGAVVGKVLAQQQVDGSFGDDWSTACAMCTLLNYGKTPESVLERAISHLLQRQGASGAWAPVAVWTAPEPPDPPVSWWGSAELTTALCLEALARCRAFLGAGRAAAAPEPAH